MISRTGLLWRIRDWVVMARTETYRVTDQRGCLKVLVYERKRRGEDVLRIGSLRRTRQYEQCMADDE
jgi:hypothetical protein